VSWIYDLMDKVGLKTPAIFIPDDDPATTWADCLRCAGDNRKEECGCLWRCRHKGCEGLELKMLKGRNLTQWLTSPMASG